VRDSPVDLAATSTSLPQAGRSLEDVTTAETKATDRSHTHGKIEEHKQEQAKVEVEVKAEMEGDAMSLSERAKERGNAAFREGE